MKKKRQSTPTITNIRSIVSISVFFIPELRPDEPTHEIKEEDQGNAEKKNNSIGRIMRGGRAERSRGGCQAGDRSVHTIHSTPLFSGARGSPSHRLSTPLREECAMMKDIKRGTRNEQCATSNQPKCRGRGLLKDINNILLIIIYLSLCEMIEKSGMADDCPIRRGFAGGGGDRLFF